ncbi:MAG: lipopolysaccharide biosynthesis protein [Cyanobacteriota bacterium]|nr:lipopolysaccharide biosynthesis protein [Cyanobacteriota bacterium]
MSFQRKVLRAAIWTAVQNWGGQFGSLLVFFVLARLLNPEDFGLVALANVFLAFVHIFLNQGFPQALVQRENLEPEHIDTAFWTNLACGCILAIAGVAVSPFVAHFFDRPSLIPILRSFSLLILISSITDVQQALLERELAFKFVALRSLLGLFAGGLVGIGFALSGFGVWSLVAQQTTYELVGAIVLWRGSPWRPRLRFSARHFRDLFSFGVNILAFNFLGFINTRADDLLVGYFLGPVALGYYSIAYRISTIMVKLLVDTCNRVALPTFSRMQTDIPRFRNAFYMATRLTSAIAFPCFLGVVVLAPAIVPWLFGDQWQPSVPVLQVLAAAGIFRSLSRFKGAVFMALGKPEWRVRLGLVNSCLNLIGFSIAARWGIVAVACAYFLRNLIMFPIEQTILGRLIRGSITQYLRQFIVPLGSALVMMGAIAWLDDAIASPALSPMWEITICTLVGAVIYLLLVRCFDLALFNQFIELGSSVFPTPKKKSS